MSYPQTGMCSLFMYPKQHLLSSDHSTQPIGTDPGNFIHICAHTYSHHTYLTRIRREAFGKEWREDKES